MSPPRQRKPPRQDEVAITCSLDHPNLTRVKALVYDRRDRWPDPHDAVTNGSVGGGTGRAEGPSAVAGGGGEFQGDGGECGAAGVAGKLSGIGGGAEGGGAAGTGGGLHAHEAARGMVLELVRGAPLAAKPTSEHLLRCK